jgi:protein-S-isoprenylcysteine O-methyltransferase Ste14
MLTLAFLGLQILLFLLRRVPEGRSPGWRPRVAALIGSNLQLGFLALPRVQMSLSLALASTVVIAIGMTGAIITALWLGRGFSIFPQARSLVTQGPYRLVRHPLYVCEQLAGFGAMLQFAMPWALMITLMSLAAQFPRMHYEEGILAATYADYKAYAARTWRLVPGVY